MLAVLGDIKFELLKAPHRINGEETFEYAEQKIVQSKPKLQWTGDGLDSYSLEIRFHSDFCDPQTEVDRIRQAGRDHLALPFVWGAKGLEGYFVIPKISRDIKETFEDGQLIHIELNFELKEFPVEDAVKTGKGKAVRTPAGTPAFAFRER